MFGIGSTELVIILVFGFLLFGPDKLPQMGRTIGRALRQFRETQEKLTAVVQTEVVDPMAAAAKKPVVATDTAASVSGDEDADADAPAAAAPARKETFAERRARLAAERAEQEAAAASGAEAAEGDVAAAQASVAPEAGAPSAAAPASTSVEASTASDTQSAASAAPAEEPAQLTTEDLYARRPRKRKAAAVEHDAVSPEASVVATEPVAASTEAPAAVAGPAAPTSGAVHATGDEASAPVPADTQKGGEQ
ncbi:MAG: twin-arginine translocase TatA/TatE family subunit [Collinsella stercoris]|nr:twin-arginine translocase TatA/TatE family subunit [Collinsella stercoris]